MALLKWKRIKLYNYMPVLVTGKLFFSSENTEVDLCNSDGEGLNSEGETLNRNWVLGCIGYCC